MTDDARFIPKAKAWIGLCLCLIFSTSLLGQEKRQQNTSKSCREFVENFYSWYLRAPRDNVGHAGDLALKHKPHLFSSDLIRQLRQDFEAQEKAGSDLVSLDADPFIGADGPPEGYVVEKIMTNHDSCSADVHFVWGEREVETPSVTPKMRFKDGEWRFVDFYFYSLNASGFKRWSLLTALKGLREDRKKNGFDGTSKSNPK